MWPMCHYCTQALRYIPTCPYCTAHNKPHPFRIHINIFNLLYMKWFMKWNQFGAVQKCKAFVPVIICSRHLMLTGPSLGTAADVPACKCHQFYLYELFINCFVALMVFFVAVVASCTEFRSITAYSVCLFWWLYKSEKSADCITLTMNRRPFVGFACALWTNEQTGKKMQGLCLKKKKKKLVKHWNWKLLNTR